MITNEYDNFKNLNILKVKIFVSIHIFKVNLEDINTHEKLRF